MRVLFHFECSNGVCQWISTKELVSFFMVESWILGVPTRKVGDCCTRKVGSRLQEYLTCCGSILQQTWPWKFVTSMEKMRIKYYKTINYLKCTRNFWCLFSCHLKSAPNSGYSFRQEEITTMAPFFDDIRQFLANSSGPVLFFGFWHRISPLHSLVSTPKLGPQLIHG